MDKQAEWLAAYVEKCMTEAWGDQADELSCFGESVAYRSGTAACAVRVESDPLMVRVMARAVLGVQPTAKLLRELNELNARSLVAHAWWHEGDVVVESSMFADGVTAQGLCAACAHVNAVANDIGVCFAAMFDGTTPYPPFADESEEAA